MTQVGLTSAALQLCSSLRSLSSRSFRAVIDWLIWRSQLLALARSVNCVQLLPPIFIDIIVIPVVIHISSVRISPREARGMRIVSTQGAVEVYETSHYCRVTCKSCRLGGQGRLWQTDRQLARTVHTRIAHTDSFCKRRRCVAMMNSFNHRIAEQRQTHDNVPRTSSFHSHSRTRSSSPTNLHICMPLKTWIRRKSL